VKDIRVGKTHLKIRLVFGLMTALAWAGPAAAEATAVFSDTGPDAAAYGEHEGYPVGTKQNLGSQRTLVGAYSHFDELRPGREVPAPATASVLTRAADELKLTYSYLGQTYTLDDYLERNPATGLLILHDHTIQYEHYRYARTDRDRFTSQSMAKTIVSMLVGLAVADGKIHSVDDKVADYIPELAGTEPGRIPLRALLQMTSGLRFHEVYDGKDDIMHLSHALMQPNGAGPVAAVAQFNVRAAQPGAVFNYAGLNTELLSLVVTKAVGMNLSDYASTRLWQPIGAEAAATWTIDGTGHEVGYCCFNAVLRDWGRLGALLANDGTWDGTQVIPKQWLLEATTVQTPILAPNVGGRRLGFGYQVWLLPGERREFALRGIFGQAINIDPTSHTVLVQTAVLPKATNNASNAELTALWNALVAHNAN